MHTASSSPFVRSMLFLLSLIMFLPAAAAAQEIPPPPITWGEIPREMLEMRSFPKDSNASAVVLCDYGETVMMEDFHLKYTRHLRVKILNEKGFRWGTMAFSVNPDRDKGEKVDEVEGMTYVLQPDGTVKSFELDEDDVFEEEVNDQHTRYKFTMPGLAPGCIVEMRVTIIAKMLYDIRGWTFQHDDPVIWSEYRLLHPSAIVYAILSKGFEQFHLRKDWELKRQYSGDVASYYGDRMVPCHFWQWAMKDIPAMRPEPYITTLSDYTSSIELQLSAYAVRGGGVQNVLNTWDRFVKEIAEHKLVGDWIDDADDATDIARSVTANITDPVAKMKAIHTWVSTAIAWDGNYSAWAHRPADEVVEKKKANSAEMNYLLVSMMRAAGLESDPLLLSTRGHGRLQELYPIVDQFNDGLAFVNTGTEKFILDATSPTAPPEVLPMEVLGVRAFRVNPEKPEWFTINSPLKGSSTIAAVMTLQEDGTVHGTIDGIYKQYLNLQTRNALGDAKAEDFVKDRFGLNASGLTLDDAAIVNRDSARLPLLLKATVTGDGYAQRAGDLLYINPHMISRVSDNPFRNPIRKYPVDYNFPREYSTIVTIILPDSFQMKEGVADKRIPIGNDVLYTRRLQQTDNRLQLISKLEIISRTVPAASYARLRDLYDSMIQAEREQIVLERIQPPPPPPAPVPAAPQPAAKAKKPAPAKKK